MAIIASNAQVATVQAPGEVMDATVDINGSLMEMLATVYAYILMAAIREAIQNACDAAKRAGYSFADGVQVLLPTPSNPMITVIDKGSGMTHDFMKSTYLSLGKSTKAGDNGSAGGLGIGRFAAYGYIRESYITTCHASDMMERTYFQFQGSNGKPQVQQASEVPGTAVGTRVYFPIKETDGAEALRAVAWLKEIMQLTMGDSFSVDNPSALPSMLPEFSGSVLTLTEFDSGLDGVRIYPMMGPALSYTRQGLQDGSLVVMTNKTEGVGGLPFHVQSPNGSSSVFASGMVIEIPMAFNIPFMPSREEIKYTDDVNALLVRIDVAAAKAAVARVRDLTLDTDIASKALISRLLGTHEREKWHWFSLATRTHADILHTALTAATNGTIWSGHLRIPVLKEMYSPTLTMKVKGGGSLKTAHVGGRYLTVSTPKLGETPVVFDATNPLTIVVNDLPSGGMTRFRLWLEGRGCQVLYLSSTKPNEAQVIASAVNAEFNGALTIMHTSLMSAPARLIEGSAVVAKRAKKGPLTYYCFTQSKQLTTTLGFFDYNPVEPVRIWLGKNGGKLVGFDSDYTLATLTSTYASSLLDVLKVLNVDKLYLLPDRQAEELLKEQANAKADGSWDITADDVAGDPDGQETLDAISGLKSWVQLEDALMDLMTRADVQDTLAHRRIYNATAFWDFETAVRALSGKPRFGLTGTKIDKALAPYLDVVDGTATLHNNYSMNKTYHKLMMGLCLIGQAIEPTATDSAERTELIKQLQSLETAGYINYESIGRDLFAKFPLLKAAASAKDNSIVIDELCVAMAAIYR